MNKNFNIKSLNNCQLYECLNNADMMKCDKELPIDVRIRFFETYSLCLREASNRGFDYLSLKKNFSGHN